MALFTIHAPVRADGETIDPGGLVVVKDGFCWPALFIPLIWTIYRRLWLVLLLLVVALVLVALLDPLGGAAVAAAYLLGRVYYALEANGLRRWTLERKGHRLIGVAEGRTIEEAELRFFAASGLAGDAADERPVAAERQAPPTMALPAPKRPAGDPHVVGLFPTPGSVR